MDNSLLTPPAPPSTDAEQPQCLAWVEHPVYFLNDKYDSVNLWHALEDVTHAFEAWALKGWGKEAQVGGCVAGCCGGLGACLACCVLACLCACT